MSCVGLARSVADTDPDPFKVGPHELDQDHVDPLKIH